MKYLRTNDGIWEVISENNLVYKVRGKRNPENIYSKSKKSLGRVKESEKIQDLIQRFVFKKHNYKIVTKSVFENMDLDTGHEIFGAIWTNQGLKYVAKLNNKKEWELL